MDGSADDATPRRTMLKRAAFLLSVVLALLALLTFARETPPIMTDSDLAVGEIYTQLAGETRLLLGPYSRFGWHHPGPLYFYVQAPLYVLSGRRAAALYAGALAINLLALVTIALVVRRENQGALPVVVVAACLLFCLRAPRFLASPWTAHVTVLPLLACVALGAAILTGRRLLPLLVIFGSFVVQTHVGLAPPVAALFAIMLAIVLVERRPPPVRMWSMLLTCGWIGLLLWLPTLIDAASHQGGNLAALVRFFARGGQQDHSLTEALIDWSYGLTGLLRWDFGLPWGAHFVVTNLWWVMPCAIGELLGVAVIARRELHAGRRFEGYLVMLMVAASVAGLWSLTRVHDDILDHEILWLAALGAMNLAVIVAAAGRAIRAATAQGPPSHQRAATIGLPLVLLLGAALGADHLQDFTSFELRRVERRQIVDAYEAIREYMRNQHVRRPLIRIDAAVWSQAAGVLLRLRRDRSEVAVADEWVPMFTDAFAANGREDAIVIVGRGRAGRAATDLPGVPGVLLFESAAIHVEVTLTPKIEGGR